MRLEMQAPRKIKRGDAFERAIRETFGESTTLAQVEQARQLYARYRTDDVLKRLKDTAPDPNEKNGKPQPWD
jgi:hypothetical protein